MDLKMIKTNLVTISDIESIQALDEYSFPNRVFKAYRSLTRNNDFITYEQARRKLIRNLILSNEAPVKEGLEHKITYYYGCLIVQLNTVEKSICYIQNKLDDKHTYKIDRQKRSVLNYIMDIQD